MSIKTLKIQYKCESDTDHNKIFNYIQNYNWVLRFTYNRFKEYDFDLETKEVTALQKTMNNIFIDSHFLNSARYHAMQYKDVENTVVFGGRKNFIERCQHKISKEEFDKKRMQPIYSVGESSKKANRKFRILDESTILFQPDRKHYYILHLPRLKANYRKDILKLLKLQNECAIPITYKLDMDYVYIAFEDIYVFDNVDTSKKIQNRIFSVDLNPNYIGWSVVDWKDSSTYKVIKAGVISIKDFNDAEKNTGYASDSPEQLYLNNKRDFENIDTAIYLVKTALHYKCSIFAVEDLSIETKDNKKGKSYNRLVNNQWNRNLFRNELHKYCDRSSIRLQLVTAAYSSFEGNLVYRETGLPDMCLASIEIGRRAYEFYHQYVIKDKAKEKNIVFDNSEKAISKIIKSLEEFNIFDAFDDLISLYSKLKTLDVKYRVPLKKSMFQAVFSKKSIKSRTILYST